MKKILFLAIFLMVPVLAPAQENLYVIGPSDLLEISVWGEDALTGETVVRTDGYLSIPLAGEVLAAGKTPPQLQKNIETSLKTYLKDPRCAVIVVEARSKRFFVEGQVNAPGQYILDRDMYLTQVIALAGGFTEWADRGSIVILRRNGDDSGRLKANYKRIVKGKDADISISPGDTIIVP